MRGREPSGTSGLSALNKDHLSGTATRLAALLLAQIFPIFSLVAPCDPGAALRNLVLVQRGQATSYGGRYVAAVAACATRNEPYASANSSRNLSS
jgi:hypothetical protein